MSPLRQVARLAAPAIAQQLLHTLVFLVDRALLGHHDAASLASMQISGPVVWSSSTILAAFTVGVVAVVGRRIGAGDRAGAGDALRASLGFALGVGALALVLGLLGRGPLLGLFPAAGPAVWAEADAYLTVAFAAMPALLLSLTLAMAVQAAGDTRTPFLVAAVGNVLNVGLSYVLIYGAFGLPSLGARGAALGSAAAFAWQAGALLVFTGGRRAPVSWRAQARSTRAERRARHGEALRRVLRVAGPSLAERLIQQTGFMAFVTMIGALGATAMGANQALIGIESIVFLSADGLGIATAAVVSQRLGARERGEATAAMRGGLGLAAGALAVVGVFFALVPRLLLRPFTGEAELLDLAVPCLYVAAVAAPIMGVAVVASVALRGAGATRSVLAVTFAGGLLVRLGATYLGAFTLDLGLFGVWLGSTADWAVRAVLLMVLVRRGRWRDIEV